MLIFFSTVNYILDCVISHLKENDKLETTIVVVWINSDNKCLNEGYISLINLIELITPYFNFQLFS